MSPIPRKAKMPAPPTARTTQPQVVPRPRCLPNPPAAHYCTHKHMFPSTSSSRYPSPSSYPHAQAPRYYGKFVGAHSEFMPFPIAPSSPSFDPHYLIPIHAMRLDTHTQRVEWSSRNHRTFLATEKCRRSHAIIPPQLITVANGTQDLLIHTLLLLHHRPLRLNSPTQPAVHQ